MEPAPDETMVCICFNVTRRQIEEHVRQPDHNFDTLVAETGIGTKCTACMLDVDLIVNSVSGGHAGLSLEPKGLAQPIPGPPDGISHPADFANSGFFFNGDGIRTVIRIANVGPMFEAAADGTGYRYRLIPIGEDGRRFAGAHGRLERDATLEIDLATIAGLPARGWFMLDVVPDSNGLVGSTRPQVLLVGRDWATAYHPQLQVYACRGRAIPVEKVDTAFHTWVSAINGYRGPARLEGTLYAVGGGYRAVAEATVGGFGSVLLDLDRLFPDAPSATMMTLVLRSDIPVRKHVINRLAGGALSVDHFPNFK
jgi:bacterioferritin-associated ferredoxin